MKATTTTTKYRWLKTTKTRKFDKSINLIKTRKIWKKSIICDVIVFWLIENENRNVELNNVLIDIIDLIDIWYAKFVIASNAICEIFAILLIEKQNRNVELNLLLKLLNLNFSNNLIDDLIVLIDLYFFVFVNDVSTRIFMLIWLTSTSIMYFCLNKLNETRNSIFD